MVWDRHRAHTYIRDARSWSSAVTKHDTTQARPPLVLRAACAPPPLAPPLPPPRLCAGGVGLRARPTRRQFYWPPRMLWLCMKLAACRCAGRMLSSPRRRTRPLLLLRDRGEAPEAAAKALPLLRHRHRPGAIAPAAFAAVRTAATAAVRLMPEMLIRVSKAMAAAAGQNFSSGVRYS